MWQLVSMNFWASNCNLLPNRGTRNGQFLINIQVKNTLGSRYLKAIFRIALKGPTCEEFDHIIDIVILLQKIERKYRFPYLNP